MSNIGLVPAIGSGEIRLMVGGGWSTEADETVSTASFDHLELHRGHYLDFNCLVPHASRIRSLWINSDCSSSSGLEKLTNVERLKISYPLGREFDFRAFPRLRHVSIDGWEKSYSVSLFECSQLESLSIEGFDQADLSDFRGLTCLRSLVLAKGKLQSLSGLANCSSLNSISLSHLRSLTNIEVVFQLIELRKLELIEALPKLNFPEAITRLHSLSHLDLRCPRWSERRYLAAWPP
jgi:Leucine-rich repeat (LRR) protein